MSETLTKRGYICKEILDTEDRYVRDLQICVDVFINPLKKKRIISEDLIFGIFGNIPTLLNINRKLLESLQAATKVLTENPDYANANIGAVILQFIPFFKIDYTVDRKYRYSEYCKLQKKATSAIKTLKKSTKFANFYNACRKNPVCRGLEMTSFLIMPVQRIPRYQLLLKELQKRTPKDHSDYPFIETAMEKIISVAKECDNAMREDIETSIKLSIQNSLGSRFVLMKPSRRLLGYTNIHYKHLADTFEATAVLFSDLMVITNRFDSDLDLVVQSKFELFLYEYSYNEKVPTEVQCQNVFERIVLTFDDAATAKKWSEDLKSALSALLERTIGAKCEICFGPLKPAYCCHCIKCDRICCENCSAYINQQDRKTTSKNMVCLSCAAFNEDVLARNTDIRRFRDANNSKDTATFIQPVFAYNMGRQQQHSALPSGWEACMLKDSRVYYFNRTMWLSSWSIPDETYKNDAPYGWQKYYTEKKEPFYYSVKTKEVVWSCPESIPIKLECAACGYEVKRSDLQNGHCPCCNSMIK